MDKGFYDLRIMPGELKDKISMAMGLGWSGVCLATGFDSGFKEFIKQVEEARKGSGKEILSGALITPKKPEDVQKMARSALEAADLVMVLGGDEEINRAAAECWEVDVLCHPENASGRDLMDQKNSGLDEVMVRYMAERCIGLEIDLSQLLSSYGSYRSQVIARMRQNILLAEKYDAPLIISSAATDVYGMRSPQDLGSVLSSLGCGPGYVKKVLGENPARIIKKASDRKNPDIVLSGLSVSSWGMGKPPEKKRMYGWY